MTTKEFFEDFTQDILAQSGAEENFTRSIFIDHMCTLLENEGTISGYALTEHKITSRGQAVDAWSYDDEFSCLTLILADFRSSAKMETLTNTEINTGFKRLRNFVDAALKPKFSTSLEESDPVAELAWLIQECSNRISKINLILVSNAELSSRVAELPKDEAGSYPTVPEVWDFGRIFRSETSGKSREDVEIDFTLADKEGLPCLPAYTGKDSLKSYLLVMPGQTLADLYRDYGERLLEQNVRTFLQFRGKVNKGMGNTIKNEPEMFFSYNNGICATAEDVKTTSSNTGLLKVKNLQIVNGGQTTASIFTALQKEKADLSNVYVQVKLSVIEASQVEKIVPRISEYSNTQNKVNAADFFSNHPFHLRMEEFSRRLWAPSPEGSIQETRWFYERARGQYANQQANITKAAQKKFLSQNPRCQMFTKTDLAKYYLSMDEAPHEVSLGAQKAFSGTPRTQGWVGRVTKLWGKTGHDINEIWFKRTIAKAILFKELDKLVYRMPWYGGYKANVVTYTLAKFANAVREAGLYVDYLAIWEKQKLPEPVEALLSDIAEEVNEVICNPPEGMTTNIGEWAKKEPCWDKVRDKVVVDLSNDVRESLIDYEESREREKVGSRTQEIQDTIHAQTYIVEKGASYWQQLRDWNSLNRKLIPREISILNIACSLPRKIPNDKQSVALLKAEVRAKSEGFYVSD
jgi:hypothetical protein